MSQLSSAQFSFDFWEFVHCARCYLPFASLPGAPPPVPFWLTECGHVICNNHLNADQSCAQCGEQGVQVVPLQSDMEPPMSDWFRPVPYAFESIAHSVRFQQETMASMTRHYKKKCLQQRALIERMKTDVTENKTLKKMVDELRQENEQLRQYIGYSGGGEEPSDALNVNGKRRMEDLHRHANGVRTNSSPRTIVTPVGPNRLTLPPNHLQRSFSAVPQDGPGSDPTTAHGGNNTHLRPPRPGDRPGTSRFIQQYAFAPPPEPELQPPVLTHARAASVRQAQVRSSEVQQPSHTQAHLRTRNSAFPPASFAAQSSKFNPVVAGPSRDRTQMPPPPTPQGRGSFCPPQDTTRSSHPNRPSTLQSSSTSGRFVPTPNRLVPPAANDNQRFVPSTPSGGPQRFAAQASFHQPPPRAPSRSAMSTHGSGQRMPFVPSSQNQQGFG